MTDSEPQSDGGVMRDAVQSGEVARELPTGSEPQSDGGVMRDAV